MAGCGRHHGWVSRGMSWHRVRHPNLPQHRVMWRRTCIGAIQGRPITRASVPCTTHAQEWVYRLRAEKFQRWVKDTDTVFEYGVGAGWNLARLRCGRRVGFDAAGFSQPG